MDTDQIEEELDPLLRGLESQIKSQVPFRDHLLVSWAQHLLVFRPFYGSGSFSKGVKAEIEHWATSSQSYTDRRAILIHFGEDIGQFISRMEGLKEPSASNLRKTAEAGFDQLVMRFLEARHSEQQRRELVYGNVTAPGLLDRGLFSDVEAAYRSLREAQSDAARAFLWQELTGFQESSPQVVLFIFGHPRDLRRSYARIADYLREGSVPGTEGWATSLQRVVGRDITDWLLSALKA